MSDADVTRLSTLAWLVATSALFIVLARWSARGSWGITSGLVTGIRGWARRDGSSAAAHAGSRDLPAFRLEPNVAQLRRPASRPTSLAEPAVSELEELPSRRI